jgi:hypothetical protein
MKTQLKTYLNTKDFRCPEYYISKAYLPIFLEHFGDSCTEIQSFETARLLHCKHLFNVFTYEIRTEYYSTV